MSYRAIWLMLLLLPATLLAQGPKNPLPTALVPPQIGTARKVFLANGGCDVSTLQFFKRDGDLNKPYNQVYAAMEAWDGYELVSSPSDADLVFQISSAQHDSHDFASLQLVIRDAKTNIQLWTVIETFIGGSRKTTFEKDFAQTVAALMNDVKQLKAGAEPNS